MTIWATVLPLLLCSRIFIYYRREINRQLNRVTSLIILASSVSQTLILEVANLFAWVMGRLMYHADF